MLSGRRLDLLDPTPLDVEIEDIALGLSRVARWNGQTVGDWSFSVISPFKAAVGFDYKAFENRLMEAIHIRFGLPPRLSKEAQRVIKRADHVAAYLEATQLAGFDDKEARKFFGQPGSHVQDLRLAPVKPDQARARFLKRFRTLTPP